MKIAIIDMDNLKNPFWGAGQARATREVSRILAKKHEVTVYCSKYPNYSDYDIDNVRYRHVGLLFKNSFIANLAFVFYIPLLVMKIKADIIIENFNAPFSVSFAPIFTKIPIVALPTMFNAIEFAKKYHLPFNWVEAIGLKFYKYMLPYSNVDSSKALKLNPKIKIKIVPQGVDEQYFKIPRNKPKYILFLGRFDFCQKGLDLLIQAYAIVVKKIKMPLVIAGHGPDEKNLYKMITRFGLEKNVRVVGPAYGNKKKVLMSNALFVAFPSRHDEMSIWELEALACGLPIAQFDIPEVRWVDKRACYLAKPFDIKSYSATILEAATGNTIYKKRRFSKKFAKSFTWQHTASQIEDFLLEILQNESK